MLKQFGRVNDTQANSCCVSHAVSDVADLFLLIVRLIDLVVTVLAVHDLFNVFCDGFLFDFDSSENFLNSQRTCSLDPVFALRAVVVRIRQHLSSYLHTWRIVIGHTFAIEGYTVLSTPLVLAIKIV